jgi:poly(3-hydroxybutyrate) depolymerase
MRRWILALTLAGCSRAPAAGIEARDWGAIHDASAVAARENDAATDDADARAAVEALAPIPPDPLFTNLEVGGVADADVVSVPNGATSPRPVIVVLHGSGDRPDWNCDAWRHITGARGFVLCPRGVFVPAESTPGDARYTIHGGAALERHLEAAFAALAARFAGYVDLDRPLAAGFSLGAIEIAQIATAHPARFSRVALVEGSHGVWTPAAARAFATNGGRRVLFGCGSPWCVPLAKDAVSRLVAGGVEARAVQARVGHTTDRPLQEAIMGEFAWWLDGDARWTATP